MRSTNDKVRGASPKKTGAFDPPLRIPRSKRRTAPRDKLAGQEGPETKDAHRQRIEREVAEYLAGGGEIHSATAIDNKGASQ